MRFEPLLPTKKESPRDGQGRRGELAGPSEVNGRRGTDTPKQPQTRPTRAVTNGPDTAEAYIETASARLGGAGWVQGK